MNCKLFSVSDKTLNYDEEFDYLIEHALAN